MCICACECVFVCVVAHLSWPYGAQERNPAHRWQIVQHFLFHLSHDHLFYLFLALTHSPRESTFIHTQTHTHSFSQSQLSCTHNSQYSYNYILLNQLLFLHPHIRTADIKFQAITAENKII